MSPWVWVLLILAAGVLAAVWLSGGGEQVRRGLAVIPQGDRADAEAIQDAPPVDIDDLARAAGVLKRGGWHEDLPLTVRERLDVLAQLNAIPMPETKEN